MTDKKSSEEKISVSEENFKMPAELSRKVAGIIFALVAGVLVFLALFVAVMIFIVKKQGF